MEAYSGPVLPGENSVNDGIDPKLCGLRYTSVDVACQKALELGQGAVLAKFDVSGAFRTVLVHPPLAGDAVEGPHLCR